MSLDRLRTAVEAMLRNARVSEGEIRVREMTLSGHPRIIWDRQVGKYRRFAELTALEAPFAGNYGALFGQWIGDANGGFGVSDAEQFDSRRLGDLDNCVAFLRAWLVEAADWRALPPWTPPEPSPGSA